jgi:NNMT/PNMT/TEMT family
LSRSGFAFKSGMHHFYPARRWCRMTHAIPEHDFSTIDPDAYFAHYYEEPHPDDDVALRLACAAIRESEPPGPLSCIDVGTGANLYPLFAALPRAASLTAWEYAKPNVDWLKNELASSEMRPQWQHFLQVVNDSYPADMRLSADAFTALRTKTTVHQGSIFDLPERAWDVATMFFCAEAVTDKQAEFDRACGCFARCVRVGGALVAAFLLNSKSYVLDGRRYSVMTLTEESLMRTFAGLTTELKLQKIGVVEKEVRSGYTGMALLTGKSA